MTSAEGAADSLPIFERTNVESSFTVRIKPDPRLTNFTVQARTKSGTRLTSYWVKDASETNLVFPPETEMIWFGGEDFAGKQTKVNKDSDRTMNINVQADQRHFLGLRQAFGFQDLKPLEIDLRTTYSATTNLAIREQSLVLPR